MISILHEEKGRVELGIPSHVLVVPLTRLVSALGSGVVTRQMQLVCIVVMILPLVSLASWRRPRRGRGFTVASFGLADIGFSRDLMRCCSSLRPGQVVLSNSRRSRGGWSCLSIVAAAPGLNLRVSRDSEELPALAVANMLAVLLGLQKLSLLLGVGVKNWIVRLLLKLLLEQVILEFWVVSRGCQGFRAKSGILVERSVFLFRAEAGLMLFRTVVAPLAVVGDLIALMRHLVVEHVVCAGKDLIEGLLIS